MQLSPRTLRQFDDLVHAIYAVIDRYLDDRMLFLDPQSRCFRSFVGRNTRLSFADPPGGEIGRCPPACAASPARGRIPPPRVAWLWSWSLVGSSSPSDDLLHLVVFSSSLSLRLSCCGFGRTSGNRIAEDPVHWIRKRG